MVESARRGRLHGHGLLKGDAPMLTRLAAGVLWLLGLVAPAVASAQYHIESWTTEHGLPQSSVVSIAQTPDGFLWVSTFGGLARFDGVSFKVFDSVTNPELPNSRLGAVNVDDDGLWVRTTDKVLMRFRDGRFHVMGAAEGLPAKTVGSVTVEEGHLIADTDNGAVMWLNGRFVPHARPAPPAGAAGMSFIGESPTGARWYRAGAGLAHRFEGERLTRTLAIPPGSNVHEDRTGRIWMHDRGKLLALEGNTLHEYGRAQGLIGFDSLNFAEDADGTMWFCEQQGLVRFRDGQFTTFTTADGLPGNGIRSVFVDREGTHWVATYSGLARLTEHPFTAYTTTDGLSSNNVYPILQDRRGDIWIGGWQGLTRFHNGVFEDVSAAYQLKGFNILSLFEDRDGLLWVGIGGHGVRRLNIAGGSRPTALPRDEMPSGPNAIYQGRGTDIWIGGAGATRYHDGIFDPPIKVGGAVNTFFEDGQGTLWIGSDAGLARYEHGVVSRLGAKDGFTGKRVRVIHGDANGALWIGTYDTGLFRFRDGRFTNYTANEGLPTNGAFEILEDSLSRFWITSNAGIYRVSKAELDDVAAGVRRRVTAVRYGREDGLANQECNGIGRPAGLRAADGRFWFPTQGGVAVVDTGAITSRPGPAVAILDLTVGGVPLGVRDRVEITSASRSFEARYTALTSVRPELAEFRYRMEGLDPDWVHAGSDRTARYTQLPFGNYRFHVSAANRDGVWNDVGATMIVAVVPPFWRTSWFTVLVILSLMVAGFVAHRMRLGTIERKQAMQQAFARQLIDSQEADRQRIATELHDGVSQTLVVIRHWSLAGERSLPDDSVPGRRLGEIADAASQALDEVRGVVKDLLPYHLERLGLVEAMREAATRMGDVAGIPITCRIDEIAVPLRPETELRLFRVMQEALNNIVKHSRATLATIEMAFDDAGLWLTIEDNGRGFEPKSVTPSSPDHGFGLVGISERARMMGGDVTIRSAPGRGTTITVVVPRASAILVS